MAWRTTAISLSAALATLCMAAESYGAQSEDPDWPCVQRLVPEVSAGMVWAGPPIDGDLGRDWRDNPEVNALALQRMASPADALLTRCRRG